MAETNLDAFKGKDSVFVADWLESKGSHKLCSVFEGIKNQFILIFEYINILSCIYNINSNSIQYRRRRTTGLICRSQVAGHCFTNTESILNILKS